MRARQERAQGLQGTAGRSDQGCAAFGPGRGVGVHHIPARRLGDQLPDTAESHQGGRVQHAGHVLHLTRTRVARHRGRPDAGGGVTRVLQGDGRRCKRGCHVGQLDKGMSVQKA